MNSLESGSNVQSGLEMIMEKSPDTIVLVDRNLTLVKVISAKDDYYHYLANNCIGKGSPDKPGGLSIQLCKSEKKEFYIRYSS